MPKKFKKEVADALRDIFYAASKKESYKFFMKFKEKWEKIFPLAVRSLVKKRDKLLLITFFYKP